MTSILPGAEDDLFLRTRKVGLTTMFELNRLGNKRRVVAGGWNNPIDVGSD